ncbi:MAG: hypothetical protein K6G11_01175 [Lachnospiraceae bacterium]|nr:hypothetical protein [Lachnospiraceae bacterium]
MRKSIIKALTGAALSLVLAASTIAPVQADAAAKSYTVRMMYMDDASVVTSFKADGSSVAQSSIKNKKGTQSCTLTLNRADCVKQGTDTKSPASQKIKYTRVLCVDVVDILKDHGSGIKSAAKAKVKPTTLKFSNVAVKVDGKAVKLTQSKLDQGWIEDDTKNYRLDICNIWNRSAENYDQSSLKVKNCCVKSLTAFNFTKALQVSFNFTIKK